MATLVIACPECGADAVPHTASGVRCGMALCECSCPGCGTAFGSEVEWWRWAGLDEPPPDET